jgi:O-acetyl-ADP-ribose deacetylase (regulator of RNase III)
MERASRAAAKAAPKEVQETVEAKAAPESAGTKKPAASKKTSAKKAPAKHVIAAPSPEVLDGIVYQESSQVLDRAAAPNERFGVGDAMPIYYY